MNELLKVNYEADRITLSARELHEFLEIKTEFAKWMHRMCEYGFSKDVDYRVIVKNDENPLGGRPSTDYEITIDMAKEIAMIQRNEKGKQARQYFIEVEKQWNSPERVIARGLIESKKMIENLNQQVIEMKPKAEFFDAVASSKNAIQMAEVAKVLNYPGYGRNRLFEFLRNKKVLMANNIPYQKYVDCGYFRVIEQKYTKPNGDTAINIKTLVYQKGINFIKKILDKELSG
ncbi:phage antirepressor KilAC domain-containing protein [Thomasclavelia spiroformis]|uniref:phage antirepressor KilAC domain-containing protein n=1 Tax=Thomasclavelia spiroformis TaxID=29348 RepID=UPI0039907BC6